MTAFKNIILIIFMLYIAGNLTGCSSATERYAFEKQKIDDKVWQCKELCSSGTIDIARIRGLRCMCNQSKQAPFINNIIMPQSQGQPYSTPSSPRQTSAPEQTGLGVRRTPSLSPKADAVVVESLNGNKIISQSK